MNLNTMAIISANYDIEGFGELTQKRPAATVPFGGRYRLIDFALSNLVNSGISSIGLIAPYYYRSLLDHVGDGKNWGLALKKGGLFILPGSIYGERNKSGRFLIKDLNRNRIFFEKGHQDYVIFSGISRVSNYDLTPFIKAHEKSKYPITLMYSDSKDIPRDAMCLNIKENGEFTGFAESSNESGHLYNGVFIIDKSYLLNMLDWYGNLDSADLIDVIRRHPDNFSIGTFKNEGYEVIVHDLRDYVAANMALLKPDVRKELFESERKIMTKVQDEPPTIYKGGSEVKNSLVAARCSIEGTVINSVLSREVKVEKGAVVKDSIIMQHSTIKANAVVAHAILDKHVTVECGHEIRGSKNNPAIIGKGRTV